MFYVTVQNSQMVGSDLLTAVCVSVVGVCGIIDIETVTLVTTLQVYSYCNKCFKYVHAFWCVYIPLNTQIIWNTVDFMHLYRKVLYWKGQLRIIIICCYLT